MKYNTEAVFEVIGNYPVVDQYDVLYPNLLSGSIFDNYVTGSMFKRVKSSGTEYTVIDENRGLAFSKLGVKKEATPSSSGAATPANDFYNLQPWRERAGTIRSVRMFSEDERMLDSYVPNFQSMIGILGGDFILVGFNTVQIRLGKAPTTFSGRVTDYFESFPFEPKYSTVQRTPKINNYFTAKLGVSGPSIVAIDPVNRRQLQIVYSAPNPRIWNTTASEEYTKLLYGFGDLKTQYPQLISGSAGSVVVSPNLPTWREGPAAPRGAIIRGWKYGLCSGMPKYTSAVFRRNKFGQLRDMLEQREVTVSQEDYDFSPSNFYGSVERKPIPRNKIEKSPTEQSTNEFVVLVRFTKIPTNNTPNAITPNVDPNFTFSSNLSQYFTSSLPFFDLDENSQGRNRGPIPVQLLSNQNTLVPGIDSSGNTTV
jgi:hypothetical protein